MTTKHLSFALGKVRYVLVNVVAIFEVNLKSLTRRTLKHCMLALSYVRYIKRNLVAVPQITFSTPKQEGLLNIGTSR